MSERPRSQAVYVISVEAELDEVHPRTLRVYERKGLRAPARGGGGCRRYSGVERALLRRIQALTNVGLNLAGVKRVMALEAEVERLRHDLESAHASARDAVEQTHREYRRDLVPVKQSVVLYRERARLPSDD
jgi:MerR family transcriptional regulator/heat shock protein HspR